MRALDPAKRESQKQWNRDPCGAHTAQDEEVGTLAFYRAIRRHRFEVYAPWFDEIIDFSAYHDLDILEIGAGLGSDHYRFAAQGNRMTALDLSTTHLEHTRRHLQLEGLGTAPVYGDAEVLPFAENSFDLVYSFGVLHHTPGTEAAIAEIRRVLRPGGTAIIGLYHRNSWFFWVHRMLVRGVLLGGLWTKGMAGVMGEIEHRQNRHSAQPLVKVYTRRRLKHLLRDFAQRRIRTCHVEAVQFPGLRRVLRVLTRRAWLERYLGFGGWFLIAKANK